MITVRVNGEEFLGFTDVSVVDSMDQLCNQFTLSCTASSSDAFVIPRGAPIQVLIDDVVILTGATEGINGNYTATEFSISVAGRDNTRNVLKADLSPSFNLKGPIQLQEVMEKTLKDAGLDLTVTNLAGDLDDFTSKEVLTDDVGGSIFDFWLPLAQKRQVLLSKDRDGNLLILRPNERKYQKALRQMISDPDRKNNIVSATWSFDDSNRRNEYNVYSQVNFTVPSDETPPADDEIVEDPFPPFEPEEEGTTVSKTKDEQIAELEALLAQCESGSERERVVNGQLTGLGAQGQSNFRRSRVATKGSVTDDAIPAGSVSHEVAENPSDDDECLRLAKWNANQARVAAINYTVVLNDLEGDDGPWEAGYLIDVVDEIADINSTMLIRSVEFNSSLDKSGQASLTATLSLTIPDAYSDDATASDTQKQVSKVGANWNDGDFQ